LSTPVLTLPEYNKPNWFTITIVALFHVGAIAALFTPSWRFVLLTLVLHWLTVGLGISMGYHRLHTHQSYRVPTALEYFLAICGTLTLQGGPIFWVATHRIHHSKSDQPGDPHSPRDGTWWAHVGWILFGETYHNKTRLLEKYTPDLVKHRFYVWLNNYHWLPTVVFGVALFFLGGLPWMLWLVCFRVVIGWHFTWFVNSVTHLSGGRRFNTRDDSRNNWWVALLTFGEGWHNNHHAHPTSARHGLAWYEFDMSWIQIWILKALGIAKAVRVAKVTTPHSAREAA